MNYKALYDYLHDISQNLDLSVNFFHGRSEIKLLVDQDKPLFIYSFPFQSSGNLAGGIRQVQESWTATLVFFMLDRPDSAIDQNDQDKMQAEIEILTICENAAAKFIHYVNENTINDDLSKAADMITINNFTKTPAIKDGHRTGFVVTLNLLVPDQFNYCCN